MTKILGESLPNIPWQEKPEGYRYPVWRYSQNPIINRDELFMSNSIFNSAVVPYKGEFAGVFRVDYMTRQQKLVVGFSKDGIKWNLSDKAIFSGYDPRLCFIEDRFYLSWVNIVSRGTTIGIAYTFDFEEWTQMEDACIPVSRNGVLFPRKVNDHYLLLSRPCDKGHTPYGDIFLSQSTDLTYWGKHRHVLSPSSNWDSTKVGAGPTPIETDEGWLMFYHGVNTSCNGFTYCMGVALLDIDQPWKVKYRANSYLLNPREYYECVGDVQNVVFPCAALTDSDTGRIAIYYGGADTVVALAFAQVDEVIRFVKENNYLK